MQAEQESISSEIEPRFRALLRQVGRHLRTLALEGWSSLGVATAYVVRWVIAAWKTGERYFLVYWQLPRQKLRLAEGMLLHRAGDPTLLEAVAAIEREIVVAKADRRDANPLLRKRRDQLMQLVEPGSWALPAALSAQAQRVAQLERRCSELPETPSLLPTTGLERRRLVVGLLSIVAVSLCVWGAFSPGNTPSPTVAVRQQESSGVSDRASTTAWSESAAIATVERLGGTLRRDENRPGNPVVGVFLRETQAVDGDLEPLQAFRELQTLDVGQTRITGTGFRHLRTLAKLEHLAAFGAPINDEALAHITTLESLKLLNLGGTRVTDEGLPPLRGLRSLQFVNLSATSVTPEGVHQLQAGSPDLLIGATFASDEAMLRQLRESPGIDSSHSSQQVAVWVEQLRNGSPSERKDATFKLGQLDNADDRAVSALCRALKDPDGQVVSLAAMALGQIGEKGVPGLIIGIQDRNTHLRESATLGLAAAGEPAVQPLIRLLSRVDKNVVGSASAALSTIGRPAVPGLIAALDDESYQVRGFALLTLGEIGPDARQAAPRVRELLADPHHGVRAIAKIVLPKIDN